MPMTWNAEAEAKLYALILQVCDVKPTEAQRAEIASRMSPDCTAKAISHKIAAIRKGLNVTLGSASTPAKRAPASKKKAVTGTKVTKEATPGSGDDEETFLTPPASAAKKNDKKRKLEEGGDGLADGKEIAVGEDVGQGFRRKKVQVKNEDSDEELL
ncbi:hypothetical protein Slin15195_G047370 [Septoria linicola]|uniref:Uncharacterized protein n=1 Tax=Septoria linicola TaxID=215465 RepID=A0A9Q9ASN5_9PEZI|nr:hypothetical protein Slin15195_G047370 [Septoria linicola]